MKVANRLEEMCYSFLETGWYDHETRHKTTKAMIDVVQRLSESEWEMLQDKVSYIIAPSQFIEGEVYPVAGLPLFKEKEKRFALYLSPYLETKRQSYVNRVVAHEFAHILLDHPKIGRNNPNIEYEADEKIKSWGYKPCYEPEEYPSKGH